MERQKAEEREADSERKRERAHRAKKAGSEAIIKGKIFPVHSVKHHHVIPAFYIF